METVVKIEVREMAFPAHWHTAEECRAKAESWENAEMKTCVEKVLASLWEIAGRGGTSGCQNILTGRPEHFYKTFQEIMENLGYIVEPPAVPNDSRYNYRVWAFRW